MKIFGRVQAKRRPGAQLAVASLDAPPLTHVPSDAILRAHTARPRISMLTKLHFGWSLTAILAVALIVRLAAGVWWQQRLPAGQKFAFGDSESYWQLGRAIAHGQPYEYGPDRLKIFRTPGYPALLAPLFWFAGEPSVLWARALSAVLSTAAVGLAAALAKILFDDRVALLAAAIAALYPESIALGVFVLSEAGFA